SICLAECARPRAQQAPPAPTRWIFTDTPLALDAAAPEDGRTPLNRYNAEIRTETIASPIAFAFVIFVRFCEENIRKQSKRSNRSKEFGLGLEIQLYLAVSKF